MCIFLLIFAKNPSSLSLTMEQIRNFQELTAHLSARADRKKIAVVCADDPETQYAIERALREQIADFILVGDSRKLRDAAFVNEFADRIEIVDEPDSDTAARRAVELAREGRAGALMKGIINKIGRASCRERV